MKHLIFILSSMLTLPLFAQSLHGISNEMSKKIHFNCYLPTDIISCDELKDAFFNANGGLTPGLEADSFLSITLRALPLNNVVEYQYTLKGQGNLPQIDFKYPLNDSLSSSERFEKVLSMTNKLTEPYKLITGTSTDSGSDPRPYYISPSVGGYGSSGQGVKDFMGYGEISAMYSTPKWRIVGDLGASSSYNSVETTAFAPGMTTKTFRQGGGVGIIRTFRENWNLAVMAGDVKVNTDIHMEDPDHGIPENGLENEARKTFISAGAEWILVPFLTEKSSGNIAIRYIIGGEHHKYVHPESFQDIQEQFAKHTAELILSRHWSKVDLSFKLSGFSSQFREELYRGLSTSSSVSYKVNKNITLDLSGSIEYAEGRIPSPAAGSASFVNLTNGNKSTTTYSGSIGIKYTIGNTRLKNRDQRFK